MNQKRLIKHLAYMYKYWCVLQGSGIIKMIRNLTLSWVKLQALYTESCIWGYTNVWHKNLSRFVCCYMPYLKYESI